MLTIHPHDYLRDLLPDPIRMSRQTARKSSRPTVFRRRSFIRSRVSGSTESASRVRYRRNPDPPHPRRNELHHRGEGRAIWRNPAERRVVVRFHHSLGE